MKVTRIEITQRRVDPLHRGDQALVRFTGPWGGVQVLAQAPRAAPTLELARDALRQLRRMPEFRSGAQELVFDTLCIAR